MLILRAIFKASSPASLPSCAALESTNIATLTQSQWVVLSNHLLVRTAVVCFLSPTGSVARVAATRWRTNMQKLDFLAKQMGQKNPPVCWQT